MKDNALVSELDTWCDDLRKTKRALSGVEVPVLF